MIKSMTGFGKASLSRGEITLKADLRVLNGKNLDLSLRLPVLFREHEANLRKRLSEKLLRGKAELSIQLELPEEKSSYSLNKPLLAHYHREMAQLAEELGIHPPADPFSVLLRAPDAFVAATEEAVEEETLNALMQVVDEATGQVDAFRLSEGAHMQQDLQDRVVHIRGLLHRILPLEEARISSIREKLHKALAELAPPKLPDPNRFEQELVYYLEKLDISEEKVRLEKHLTHFEESMEEAPPNGKKLAFIAQEMGREINTLGSKANDAAIQRLVVEMKDELEKIKEQLMNIL